MPSRTELVGHDTERPNVETLVGGQGVRAGVEATATTRGSKLRQLRRAVPRTRPSTEILAHFCGGLEVAQEPPLVLLPFFSFVNDTQHIPLLDVAVHEAGFVESPQCARQVMEDPHHTLQVEARQSLLGTGLVKATGAQCHDEHEGILVGRAVGVAARLDHLFRVTQQHLPPLRPVVRDCLDDVLPVKQQLACGKLLLQMLTKPHPLQSNLPRWHDTAVGGSRDDTRGREVERRAWQQLIPLLGIGHWGVGLGVAVGRGEAQG